MKSQYNIHGLYFEVTADHPMPFDMIDQELRTFRTKTKINSRRTVQYSITTLPIQPENILYPAPFDKFCEVSSQLRMPSKSVITRYGRSLITIINDVSKHRIQAAIVPDPSLFPDPAHYHCLTQPIGFWLKQSGLFFLHSACITDGQKGILIAGQSGAGKSSLAVAAVRAGFKYLGDEHPFLTIRNGQLRAYAFPRRVRLNRSVAAIFPELKSVMESSTADRLVFPIEQIWPNCLVTSCTPRLLIFPKFQSKGPMRISRLEPSEALRRLLQDDQFIWYLNGFGKKVSEQYLALVSRLVEETVAFQLNYRTKDILKIPTTFRRLLK